MHEWSRMISFFSGQNEIVKCFGILFYDHMSLGIGGEDMATWSFLKNWIIYEWFHSLCKKKK